MNWFSSVQFCSAIQLFPTLYNPMNQASSTLGLPVHHQFPELSQTHIHWVVIPSNHLILCHPLLLLPSIFPASGYFQMSQLFPSGGQSIGVSASTSVLPVNIQDWSPLGWTGWISLQSKGQSSPTPQLKASILWCSAFFTVQLSHPYMTTGKTVALIRRTFVGKVMSLLLNMLSRLVIAFLQRSKHLLISWL